MAIYEKPRHVTMKYGTRYHQM